MQPRAVIDVGTNSVKLLIAEKRGGELAVLTDRMEITRLGEGLSETGNISPEAFARSLRAIERMCGEARDAGAAGITVVGTEGLRRARNAALFAQSVAEVCGVPLEIIDGAEEAYLSYRAVESAARGTISKDNRLCLFDIGGGSTEVVVGDADGILWSRSLPVGALVLHDRRFGGDGGPVAESRLNGAFAEIRAVLENEPSLADWAGRGRLTRVGVGVGGTVTTMAAVMLGLDEYDSSRVRESVLGMDEVERQIALYASMPVARRREIAGLSAKRADIILPGACILRALMDFCAVRSIAVSDRGLRCGVMERALESP
jgi:exopolyphosphatase/guanosine-5'-triphosphate,3'-diphosphate pyrophosphatase